MRFFLRSRQFKIILAIFCVVLVATLSFVIVGKHMSPQTDIASTIATPFRNFFASLSNTANDFLDSFNSGNKLNLENAELKSEIDSLRQQLADYEEATQQNEFYKDFLDIKENNPDFSFTDATLIARDSDDPYGGFTINKGSTSNISKYDPVITESGIVGYVTDVGLTSAKVTTILSPDITLGALDNRTSDSGVITGSLALAQKGF